MGTAGRIFVTGSIATDYLMTFAGRFTDQLLPDQLHSVSLSFLVDDLTVRRGGVAANISYGLGLLGMRPVLAGAAGQDFGEWRDQLESHGVDTSGVLISNTLHTSRFLCTTDSAQNQIASFYSGAMSEARDISLTVLAARTGRPSLVLVSPNDPQAMLRHVGECRSEGYAFAADVSQQLATVDREQLRELVGGASYLFTNEYEHGMLEQHSEWSTAQVLDRVGLWVTTLGAAGVRLQQSGANDIEVRPPAAMEAVDPTGGGDAFRAGFLTGASRGLDDVRSAQLGCLVAGFALATVGSQEYRWDAAGALTRLRAGYGMRAAQEILGALPASGVPAVA